jgi:hypothetical protein
MRRAADDLDDYVRYRDARQAVGYARSPDWFYAISAPDVSGSLVFGSARGASCLRTRNFRHGLKSGSAIASLPRLLESLGTIRLLNRNMQHACSTMEVVGSTFEGMAPNPGEIPLVAALELIAQGEACWLGEPPPEAPCPPEQPAARA